MAVALRHSEQRKQFVLVADSTDGPRISTAAREAGFKFDGELRQFVTPYWWQAEKFSHLAANDAQQALQNSKLYYELSRDTGDYGKDLEFQFTEGNQLQPFQKSGVKLIEHWCGKQGAVLLADEAGLGKSLEFIGAYSRAPGATLITCPSFATYTWQRFFKHWLGMTAAEAHVVEQGREDPLRYRPKVVIVGYSLIHKVWPRLADTKWHWWAADEVHRLKNASTIRAQACLGWRHKPGILARNQVFITGTPVPKKSIGLYNLLSRRMPQVLGEYADYFRYLKRYCGAWNNGMAWVPGNATNTGELNMRLRSYGMIRRLKKDVQKQLPKRQTRIFELKQPTGITKIIKRQTVKTQGTDWKSMRALSELFKKSDAFSLLSELAEPKAPLICQFAADLLDEGADEDKIFIVYRHSLLGYHLAEHLARYGVVHIHGGVPMKKRPALQATFQSRDAGTPRIMLGQMEAVKENLTFTAADQCIFAEMTWLPGDIQQIVDRLHRIGQDSDRLIAWFPIIRGTIEEHMCDSVLAAVEEINEILA